MSVVPRMDFTKGMQQLRGLLESRTPANLAGTKWRDFNQQISPWKKSTWGDFRDWDSRY